MSRRLGRRNRRGRKGGQAGYMIMTGIFVAMMVGMVGFSVFLRGSRLPFDEITLCTPVPPPRVYVVAVDVSDSITPVQRKSITNQIAKLEPKLQPGDQVQLFSIDPSENLLDAKLTLCRPKRGQDVSMLTASTQTAEELFEERFERPFSNMLDDLLDRPTSDTSPIMRGIQAAVVGGLGALPDTSERHLIIVSDMLEFDQGRSHYKQGGYDPAQLETQELSKLEADMRGIDVEIWYIQREGEAAYQGVDHIAFWEAYLARNGATVSRVYKVEG